MLLMLGTLVHVAASYSHGPPESLSLSHRCANCSAFSPSVKKQGHTKLFKVWPSKQAAVQNRIRGLEVKGVLDRADEVKHYPCPLCTLALLSRGFLTCPSASAGC